MKFIQGVQSALGALKKVATKGKTKKALLENIDNLSSTTVLLNSYEPSKAARSKLVSVLRASLVPLYSSYTETSLQFSLSVLQLIINDGILPCIQEASSQEIDKARLASWEQIGNSLLSGVIDFLEVETTDEAKTAISRLFYTPLCDLFFHDNYQKTEIDPSFRSTAYLLLSETAAGNVANQTKLRDEKLLGCHKLGLIISQTKDFSALENLLNLFARLLPFLKVSKEKLDTFIRDVFQTEHFTPKCGNECFELLKGVGGDDWDETCTKLIDAIAQSDISFPQPFDVDEITVYGVKYPQPEFSDRFIIDKTAFFIDVQQEDGMYETLRITYADIQSIIFGSSNGTRTLITMKLEVAPRTGDQNLTPSATSPELLIEILNNDLTRFKRALEYRNLLLQTDRTANSKLSKRSKVSVTDSALLDYEVSESGEAMQIPDSSQKVQEMEKFYTSDPITPISPTMVGSSFVQKTTELSHEVPRGQTMAEDSVTLRIDETAALKRGHLSDTSEPPLRPSAREAGKQAHDHCNLGVEKEAVVKGDKQKKRGRPRKTNFGEKKEPNKSGVTKRRGRPPKKISATTKESTTKGGVQETENTTEKGEDCFTSDKENVSVSGPRRAAAITATTRTAKALDGEANLATDNEDLKDAPHSTSTTSTTNKPSPVIDDSTIIKAAKVPAKKTMEPQSTPLVEPLQPSRISRINRMRAKDPTKDIKATQKVPKRPNDNPSEDGSPLKKLRTATETKVANNLDKVMAVSQISADDNSPIPKRSRRSKKKADLADFNTPVDWDNIPYEVSVTGQSSPLKQKTRSLPLTKKKENRTTVNHAPKKSDSDNLGTNFENAKQPLIRVPLQTVTPAPNVTEPFVDSSTVSLLKMKGKAKRFHGISPAIRAMGKTSEIQGDLVLPKLEDVVRAASTPIHKTKNRNIVSNVVDLPEDDDQEAASTFYRNADVFELESRRKSKKVNYESSEKVLELPVEITRPKNSTLATISRFLSPQASDPSECEIGDIVVAVNHGVEEDDDDEEMDITHEDIKEALESLREKRRQRREGKTPQLSPEHITFSNKWNGAESLLKREPKHDVKPAKMDFRPRVKFDENPRFKSVSIENYVEREPHKGTRIHDSVEKKPRLSGENGTSHISNLMKTYGRNKAESRPKKEPEMEGIANVIGSIHDVIVSNIANKSRAVRTDIRISRNRLLQEAVADLEGMREECVENLNNLFTLEAEYANFYKKLNNGFERILDINSDICGFLKQTNDTYNKRSLTKIMPRSLFEAELPEIFLKYTR